MMNEKNIKAALEAMMFVWGEPLSAKQAADVFDVSQAEIFGYFKELQQEYEQEARGIRIRETGKAFQFVTDKAQAEFIERLCTPVKQKKLSQSALEVLAIIAYKQPVTKGEIEAIRGIKCDRVIDGLAKKELIEEVGRSQAIGRPILWGTTDAFLRNFNLSNIKELPLIEDIEELVADDGEISTNEARMEMGQLGMEI